ncbi:MAG: hypothetical protein EXR87_04360, partial [Gammaproteobacteria bacterium]|nr:hypothetical protein [Gammaproteobacteria bacterium]
MGHAGRRGPIVFRCRAGVSRHRRLPRKDGKCGSASGRLFRRSFRWCSGAVYRTGFDWPFIPQVEAAGTLRYHARRSGGVAGATAVGQRGPVAVPRNHKVDQEAPSRGLFCFDRVARNGPRAHFFVSGADGGRVRNRLLGLLDPVLAGLGYELVEVEFSPASSRALVRLYIDRIDGVPVALDDCER